MSCYYCPAVHYGHSVQQNESEKQSLHYCWEKKAFFFSCKEHKSVGVSPPDNNEDFAILTKEPMWCAFRRKTLRVKSVRP